MKNILSLRFAWLQSLRNVFVLSAFLAFSGIVIASLNGCSSGPTSPGAGVGTQTTTIYGRIVDESGAAVSGASVSAGTGTSVTDANGLFLLKNAIVPAGRAVVIAKKTGYFNAAHAEAPKSNGTTRIDLSMMSDGATGTISATNGGTVNVTGGASIAFSGGSFTDASGTAYTGTVSVAARYLDPKNETFFDYFAGDDLAQTASGKSASLISSGVLRVELRGASGQTLKLDASKPATLSFPKPIDPKAPATMPLWYFDETLGMWKEDGSATLKNGMYSGTVTHFTEWNLDYYDSTGSFGIYGDVSLRVTCNGAPVDGVVITIVGDDAPGKYFVHPGGKTGADGRIHFIRFPANRATQIDIRSSRNSGLYFINTPITVNLTSGQSLDLGDISLNSPCPATIKGSLTACDDSKTEGLVTISDGKNFSYIYTKTGDFAEQAPALVPLTVDAMDANGNQATTVNVPALTSGELRDIGNIKICGSATATYLDVSFGSGSNSYGQVIAFSPDGSRLAAWTEQPAGFTIFDTKTGNILSTAKTSGASYLSSMEFSIDNNKLLLSSTYGASQIYDVSSAAPTMIISLPNVMSAKLYDDGSKIIGAVSQGYPNPPLINVFSAADGSVIQTIHATNLGGSSDSIGTFGFIHNEESIVYPDGKTLGTTRVWGIQTDLELRNFPMAGNNYSFFTSEDGLTASATNDYTTYFSYNTKTGQKYSDVTLSKSGRESSPVLTQNNFYTSDQVSGASVIRITKLSDGTSTIKLFQGTSYISSIAASRNEQYLAAYSTGKIRIWKLQ